MVYNKTRCYEKIEEKIIGQYRKVGLKVNPFYWFDRITYNSHNTVYWVFYFILFWGNNNEQRKKAV